MNPEYLWSPRHRALFFDYICKVNRLCIFLREKLIAAFLLMVLVLSMLPVRHVHDLWADHDDEYTGCGHVTDHQGTCVYDASLVCEINFQVVELPYAYSTLTLDEGPVQYIKRNFSSPVAEPSFHFSIFLENRGPPSLIS